jgi:molybdopterin-guanine dinucleotide biosynthesis protein A
MLLETSAVILAGGFSKRFGLDKGLVELAGRPLILHVFDSISGVVDEIIIVVSSKGQIDPIECLLQSKANIVVDESRTHGPLIGASTGFKYAKGKYSLLLPCDTPFVSSRIASLLLDLCINKSAVIPRWPNGYVEPLQAAYHTESALTAAKTALKEKKLDLQSMIAHLKSVRYVPTVVLERFDSELLTFFNINTLEDLTKAEYRFKADPKMPYRSFR